ncbi:hypothetical protein K438DRAFT_1961155 [Mycena galopus ATCC 62051]|nr:hypothetical protein K438DRAFT_1961155 [Mycena galopus ATCC 62051]
MPFHHAPIPPTGYCPPYYTPDVSTTHPSFHPGALYDPIPDSASGYIASMGPIPKVFVLSVAGWLEDDKLSLQCTNYVKWSRRVLDDLGLRPGATRFLSLDGNPCPSFQMYPGHYRAWHDINAHYTQ